MKFFKMQGTGNDYLFLDHLTPEAYRDLSSEFPQLVQKICSRRTGVGADGVILLIPSEWAIAKLLIWNADGSRAETCGNGLRCAARYLFDAGYVLDSEFTLETASGLKTVILEFQKVK